MIKKILFISIGCTLSTFAVASEKDIFEIENNLSKISIKKDKIENIVSKPRKKFGKHCRINSFIVPQSQKGAPVKDINEGFKDAREEEIKRKNFLSYSTYAQVCSKGKEKRLNTIITGLKKIKLNSEKENIDPNICFDTPLKYSSLRFRPSLDLEIQENDPYTRVPKSYNTKTQSNTFLIPQENRNDLSGNYFNFQPFFHPGKIVKKNTRRSLPEI